MKQIIIFIGLIGLMVLGCKKPPSIYNYAISPGIIAKFNFKQGSYWIYKDSISGRVDSFFVMNNISYRDKSSLSSGYTIDYIGVGIVEYNISGIAAADTQNWGWFYEGDMICLYYPDAKIYLQNIKYAPLINYPFTTNLANDVPNISGVGDTVNINIYNTFSLNGQNYDTVAAINCKGYLSQTWAPGYLPFSFNNWFYICPNIGLVKIRLYQPQDSLNRIWELQWYHIVN